MYGFAVFLGGDFFGEKLLYHMSERLAHRGRDDYGVWSDKYTQIGLSCLGENKTK